MRAQISRISATTHISPGNFFLFDADEDDEMDARDTFAVNEEFEPISVQELVDESLSRWVHHVQFILPQVGVKWLVLLTEYGKGVNNTNRAAVRGTTHWRNRTISLRTTMTMTIRRSRTNRPQRTVPLSSPPSQRTRVGVNLCV